MQNALLDPVCHWSTNKPYTKYEVARLMCDIMQQTLVGEGDPISSADPQEIMIHIGGKSSIIRAQNTLRATL